MSKQTKRGKPIPIATAVSAKRLGMSLYRCQMPAYKLRDAAARLFRGHSNDVPDGHLDDGLRLGWQRWDSEGGRLRLTPDGAQVCSRMA